VAPIGFGMLSIYGVIVVLVEFVLFCPLLFVALRPATARPTPVVWALTGLWIASVWLVASTDPVRESIVGFILRDRTEFTAGFSESAFRTIRQGLSDQDVHRLLGPPHGEAWFYPPRAQPTQRAADTAVSSLRECRAIRFENRVVVSAYDTDACRAAGIQAGTSLDEVHRMLGTPHEACWQYGWTPGFAVRLRVVCFERGTVDDVIGGWAMSE
jgi:outer membrane protein assembly factor BamE (lipoprotein component of BamABCDE complex)